VIPPRFQPLIDEVRPVADAFVAAGHRIYLVGGIVRDALLGRERAELDLDLTTDARPEQTLAILRSLAPEALWTQGQRFGTIGARIGGRAYEITTHRAEAYSPDSRKPDVTFSTDIEADLSRRDFTVNAMALSVPEPVLIDPFDGMADLLAKRLRTPLDPEISFSDDPLRMLRAARFLAGLDLEPDDALVAAVRSMAERIDVVSVERIRDEFDKLMVVDRPGRGLWFVVDTGLAQHFFPELPALHFEQDPVHRHKDVLTHTIAVVEKTSPNRILRLAALYHDIAKPATKGIGPQGITFHHHDMRGAKMTRKRMRALSYSNDDVDAVAQLVALHLRVHTYAMGWTDSAVRRYVRDAGPLLDLLNELQRCDCTTRNPRKAEALARRMDELEDRIATLREQEELDAIRPDLDGNDIMRILDVAPGRVIGDALAMLLEARLEEGPLGAEEAERRLKTWWADRAGSS
jgi:poly(A) polymerase